jgi:hypothetical protein
MYWQLPPQLASVQTYRSPGVDSGVGVGGERCLGSTPEGNWTSLGFMDGETALGFLGGLPLGEPCSWAEVKTSRMVRRKRRVSDFNIIDWLRWCYGVEIEGQLALTVFEVS